MYLNKSPMFTECSVHMQLVSLRYCVLVMSTKKEEREEKTLLNICICGDGNGHGAGNWAGVADGLRWHCVSVNVTLLALQSIKCQKCIADNKPAENTVRASSEKRY